MSAPAIPSLQRPDALQIRAIESWLALGELDKAKTELAGLSLEARQHPDGLHAALKVYIRRGDWNQAHATGDVLVKLCPRSLDGWIERAYAARRMPAGGLQAAWDALLPGVEQLPFEAIIPYNLACYACQMGKPRITRRWLRRACDVAVMGRGRELMGRNVIMEMALDDPDLAPLREELKHWFRK